EPESSYSLEADPDLLAGCCTEQLGRVATADRERDVPVRVLVEDHVALAGIGEGAWDDRVVAIEAGLDVDHRSRRNLGPLQVLAGEVQLHVSEAVDVDDGGADSVLADLRLGQVAARHRVHRAP